MKSFRTGYEYKATAGTVERRKLRGTDPCRSSRRMVTSFACHPEGTTMGRRWRQSYLHCDTLLSSMIRLVLVLRQDPNPSVRHAKKYSSSPPGKDWIFSETSKENRNPGKGDDLGISILSRVNFYMVTAMGLCGHDLFS